MSGVPAEEIRAVAVGLGWPRRARLPRHTGRHPGAAKAGVPGTVPRLVNYGNAAERTEQHSLCKKLKATAFAAITKCQRGDRTG